MATKKIKFDIDDDDEEERVTISINGIGKVILAVTYPEYEFLEDIGEDGLEELGVEEGDMIGKIEHLEIEDEYKGQGYAKLLMNKAIEVAKEKGLMPLYLNASPMGSRGLDINDLTSFYESFGFEVFLEQGNNNLMILK
jgi:GNAT superfamily N-acetyltransferase